MTDNLYNLGEIFYILEYSLAHTLASKHRTSLSKIFKKYGKPIEVHREDFKGKMETLSFSKPQLFSKPHL